MWFFVVWLFGFACCLLFALIVVGAYYLWCSSVLVLF